MPSPPSHDSPELRLRAELEAQLRHAHRIARLGAFERDLRTGVAVWSPELIYLLGVDPGDSPNIDSFLDLVHPTTASGPGPRSNGHGPRAGVPTASSAG